MKCKKRAGDFVPNTLFIMYIYAVVLNESRLPLYVASYVIY